MHANGSPEMRNEFMMIPEFAPQKSVWLQWPTQKLENGVDLRSCIPAFAQIERECCTEGEVHNIVLNKNAERIAKQKLTDAGVPLDNIFFHIMPYDSCWMRDNGPIFVRKNGQEHILNFGFNSWGYAPWGPYDKDDKVPERIAELLGIGHTQVQYVDHKEGDKIRNLIYEGGTLEFSGEGTTAGSWAICQHRNPHLTKEQATRIFKNLTGAHTVIWIDSVWPETTAEKAHNHTDGYMKFYDKGKVCVLDSEVDGPGREAATKLEQAGWDVYRLPSGFRWTFVNCFVFNRKVIAGYVDAPMTPIERETMEKLYPNKTIIAIEIGPMAQAGGGVHCVTQQQPK
jgi:agmatine deiminase